MIGFVQRNEVTMHYYAHIISTGKNIPTQMLLYAPNALQAGEKIRRSPALAKDQTHRVKLMELPSPEHIVELENDTIVVGRTEDPTLFEGTIEPITHLFTIEKAVLQPA